MIHLCISIVSQCSCSDEQKYFKLDIMVVLLGSHARQHLMKVDQNLGGILIAQGGMFGEMVWNLQG